MILLPALLPFLTAFFITALLTAWLLPYIKKMGLYDDPKLHIHPGVIHKKPIPRGGGIPLFLGSLVAAVFFIPVNAMTIALFVATLLALIIGIIDDKLNSKSRDVSPYIRFLVNILSAVIVVGSGISISFITNPFAGGRVIYLNDINLPFLFNLTFPLSQLISVFWIVWVMNMLNWSKGVDGQMPGIVIISAVTIGILSLRFPSPDAHTIVDATLAFIVAGAMAGFLIYNYHPAKIFPGYGATAMYLLLAVISILSSSKLATAILVMGVPTADAIFTIGRRLINKKSPFFGDNKHLHHLLLDLGYTQSQIAWFYWSISAMLGLVALTLESKSKLFAIIMLGIIMGMLLSFLHWIPKFPNEKNLS